MTTINGLPAHILLVHAIVVLLPLTALLLILTAVWPAARARLAGPNALLSLVVVALVPITTSAGEWLEHRVTDTPLLHDHTELGDTAVWVALPVAVMALIVWWRNREAAGVEGHGTSTARRSYLAPRSVTVTRLIAVAATVLAVAAVYDIYLIGDSGAKASWTGQFSSAATGAGPGSLPGD